LNYQDKLIFILALTSNNGANDFQKQKLTDGSFFFQKVISKVHSWNKSQNCGIVFGATNDNELRDNLDLIGNLPVLLPGIGAQGGDLNSVVQLFKSKMKNNFLINVSRGILYKSKENNFAAIAREELLNYNSVISK
jgi:orotidine-5'-phosphate decarboxylase